MPVPQLTVQGLDLTGKTVIDSDGLRINHGVFKLPLGHPSCASIGPLTLLDFKSILEYPQVRTQWDGAFDSAAILSIVDEKRILCHSKTRSFWPVQARECIVNLDFMPLNSSDPASTFSFAQWIDSLEAGFQSRAFSVDSPDIPLTSGYTRAFLHFSEFSVQRFEGYIQIDLRVKSDPKGSIPIKLLSLLSDMVPKNLSLIYQYFLNFGAPPALIYNYFGGVKLNGLDYDDRGKVLSLDYSQPQPGVAVSLVRVSMRWLRLQNCDSVAVTVSHGESYVNVKWQVYEENVYIAFEVSNFASLSIAPSSQGELKVLLNRTAVACGDFMNDQLTRRNVQSSPSADNSLSACQDESIDNGLGAATHTALKFQLEEMIVQEKILKTPHTPTHELQTHIIPQENHPAGLVFGSKVVPVPDLYTADEYILSLIGAITNFTSRASWDEVYDHGKVVGYIPFDEDIKSRAPHNMLPAENFMKIVRTVTAAPWPVSPRYLIILYSQFKQNQSTVILGTSVTREFTKLITPNPESNEHVRGTLDFSRWTLTPHNSGKEVEITFMIKSNPNGTIPGFVLQKLAKTFPQSIENAVTYHADHGAYPYCDGPFVFSVKMDQCVFELDRSIVHRMTDGPFTLTIDKKWLNGGGVSVTCGEPKSIKFIEQSSMHVKIAIDLSCNLFHVKKQSELGVFLNGSNVEKDGSALLKRASSVLTVSEDDLALLSQGSHLFSMVMDRISSEQNPKKSEIIELDSNLLECRLSQADFLAFHLGHRKRIHAELQKTIFPYIYKLCFESPALFSTKSLEYVLMKKKIAGSKVAKTITILYSLKSRSYLALIIENLDAYLTRKSKVTIYNTCSGVNVNSLIGDLHKSGGMFFRTISSFGTANDALHENESEVKCDDAIVAADRDGMKFSVSIMDSEGELIIPERKACDILIDSDDPRVSEILFDVRSEGWIYGGKLSRFWVVHITGAPKGMNIEAYLRFRNDLTGVFVNGRQIYPAAQMATENVLSTAVWLVGAALATLSYWMVS